MCLCCSRFKNIYTYRPNTSQGNETTPSYVNGIMELTLHQTQFETQQSLNNDINSNDSITSVDGTENHYHEILQYGAEQRIFNTVTDNISKSSLSDDSSLVPSRKYINLEIAVTDEHNEQIVEQEYSAESSYDSNSESSQTHIKSDNKYETLATITVVEHSYEIPNEIY